MAAPFAHMQLLQRASAAFQAGAMRQAAELCAQVLREFGEDPNAHMLLGIVRIEEGDADVGIGHLERACALMPTHIHALVNLGSAYLSVGRLEPARTVLEKAVRVDPWSARARTVLGHVHLELGDSEAATSDYELALAAQPDHADALAGLARIAEEQHRLDDARARADQALAVAPCHALASLTRARVALRDADAAKAVEVAENLLHLGAPTPTNRALAEGYLGEAFDQLGRTEEAYAAFIRANDILYALCAREFADDHGPMAPETVAQINGFVLASEPSTWRPAPPTARNPIFLIGFPRSGTTLLEQILASHPRIVTLEERDNLAEAALGLVCSADGFKQWASLPAAEIERLRSVYWANVDACLSDTPARDVFIDKLPLNSIYLPLIHRLFPQAKIIFAIRDPRDVILSCFQQRFGMNTAMFQFLRFDSTVAYYDAVMSLVESSRAKFCLDLHEVRHESLVTDFDAVVSALLAFLGLDWNDGVHDHVATAKRRTIGTPSAAQVVQPIRKPVEAKWRRYQRFLEPQRTVIDRWVRHFGYSLW